MSRHKTTRTLRPKRKRTEAGEKKKYVHGRAEEKGNSSPWQQKQSPLAPARRNKKKERGEEGERDPLEKKG